MAYSGGRYGGLDNDAALDAAVDALTLGGDEETQAEAGASVFLLESSLGSRGLGMGTGGLSGSSSSHSQSLHDALFKGFDAQPLHHGQRVHQQSTDRLSSSSSVSASDISALLNRVESSRLTSSLAAGSTSISALHEFDDFDFGASSVLKLVSDEEEEEEEAAEVEAAHEAVKAWGSHSSIPASSATPLSTPIKGHIPAPGADSSSPASLPVPHPTPVGAPPATPAKGVVSLAELESRLKSGASPANDQQAQAQTLPQSQTQAQPQTQSQVQGGTQFAASPAAPPQSASPVTHGYTGPPIPQFPSGAPAPPGLSVDEHERPHWYIPLTRPSHQLGFMTKSEIALVLRIQLSQLQNIGSALSDDFYYQVMQARKGGQINATGQVILPVFKSGQARNADGGPKLPEGTLGRISAFSVHKPKKLMALDSGSNETETMVDDDGDGPRRTNLFASRTLSYLIEEGYRCLMDIEDVDAMLASVGMAPQRFEDPARAFDRQRLISQRAELCNRLMESLDLDELPLRTAEVERGEHLVFKFFTNPKGRLLIYRALVLLNPPHTYQLTDVLMHDLNAVALPHTPAPSTDEKLVSLLSDLVYAMPLLPYANQIFSYFISPSQKAPLLSLMRSPLLCQLLQVLLKKGHEATVLLQQNPHVQTPPGVPDIREAVQQWRAIFDAITQQLRGNIAKLFDALPKDAKPTLPQNTANKARKGAPSNKEKEKKGESGNDAKSNVEESEKKDEEKSDSASSSSSPSPLLATRFAMWELMAAFFSHANTDQRVWLNAELKDVMTSELEMLYGEYREKKKQATEAAANAAARNQEQAEQQTTDESVTSKEDKANESDSKDGASSASTGSGRRASPSPPPRSSRHPVSSVPPAASLPPPPSPALRFLSSALLGDESETMQSIARTWQDLHNDYSYYIQKHQQKLAQEQSRIAQQQQMRQQRQMQQQSQWQQYQQTRGGNGPHSGAANAHTHTHTHTRPPFTPNRHHSHGGRAHHYTPRQATIGHTHPLPHTPNQSRAMPMHMHASPASRSQHPHASPHHHQALSSFAASSPAPSLSSSASLSASTPSKPTPTWVKVGTSGASLLKSNAKAQQQQTVADKQ